jgi:predicted nucleotidyltransferase
MERDEIINEIVSATRLYLGDEYKMVMFGSWARGDALPNSDLDIGILGPHRISHDVMGRVKRIVDAIPTLRSIDIVDLMAKDESFRENALKDSKVLV